MYLLLIAGQALGVGAAPTISETTSTSETVVGWGSDTAQVRPTRMSTA